MGPGNEAINPAELAKACFSAVMFPKLTFHHLGGGEKLVDACWCAVKDLKLIFNRGGSCVDLVDASLSSGKIR